MVHSRQKERWILYTLAVMLCMVLASFWLMCNIYARYSTQTSGSDSARVARFDVQETGTLSEQIINANVYPGFSGKYTVSVKNNSEVTIAYVMNIKNKYNNLPLQFRMLDKDGKEITTDSSDDPSEYVLSKSDEIVAKDSSEHTYQLEISWPTDQANESENLQDPDYAGKVDVIEITLKAVQKD